MPNKKGEKTKKEIRMERYQWKTRMVKPLRQIAMGVHQFKRTWSENVSVTGVWIHGAIDISLDKLPNWGEFTNLFDEYKICAIKTKFIYSHNSSDAKNLGTASLPIMYLVRDYDDATPLTNYNDYSQYENLKVRRMDKPIGIYSKPKCSSALYTGALFTGYGSMKSQWIDCSSAGVKHYAVKFGIDPIVSGTTDPIGKLVVFHTLYFKCRGVR